ncbi:U32 family peptidase [Ectothiorhodospiraceae bacterium WFHF3C12]|nr:U32 family peptidase [Ectothiorhodospiraceae bacterium WFHF3C12]
MELVCPAGGMPALRAALENGADAVYLGLRDETNARSFPGLNFAPRQLGDAVALARRHGARVLLALNTYAQHDRYALWTDAVDIAADAGVDAVIAADPGVMAYAAANHPRLRLHLSVQASATTPEALAFYRERFGISRAVLPRVLSLAQVEQVAADSPVELEVFAFGSLCVMVEGRCLLSSYVTGQSPNTHGVCSPAAFVRWEEGPETLDARLGGVLIDRFSPDENAGYPTLCKGRFQVAGQTYHALEEPTSLNTLELLPRLRGMGITAVKIEGRQRSPAYVAAVTRVWRAALDQLERGDAGDEADWRKTLARLSEGSQTTLGAYHRSWQ